MCEENKGTKGTCDVCVSVPTNCGKKWDGYGSFFFFFRGHVQPLIFLGFSEFFGCG